MTGHITDIKKIVILIVLILQSCSGSRTGFKGELERDCIPYKFVELSKDPSSTDETIIEYSTELNIIRQEDSNTERYLIKNRKVLEVNPNKIWTLLEMFNNKFLLISECTPNKMVAGPYLLNRNKLWVYNTDNDKIYVAELNGRFLTKECNIREIITSSHHPNSPFGLLSIDTNNLKLTLLDTTQKEVKLELTEISI